MAGVERGCGRGVGMQVERKPGPDRSPIGQEKDTGFYSTCDWKAWRSLKQGINII